MGVPESSGSRNSLMMKSLFIVGAFLAAYVVAEAEPEATPNAEANADPWYAYSGYGLGHYGYRPYYGGYYRPYGYRYWGRKKRKVEGDLKMAQDTVADLERSKSEIEAVIA